MERQITLDDNQIKEIVEYYRTKRKGLLDKIIEIQKEISKISALLEPLEESLSDSLTKKLLSSEQMSLYNEDDPAPLYNMQWSKTKKAEWVLEKAEKTLTIREIIGFILQMEPELLVNEKIEERDLITQYSATISTKAKSKNKFFRRKNDSGIYEYGLIKNKSTQ